MIWKNVWIVLIACTLAAVAAGCAGIKPPALGDQPEAAGIVVVEGTVNVKLNAMQRIAALGMRDADTYPIGRGQIGNGTALKDGEAWHVSKGIKFGKMSTGEVHDYVVFTDVKPGQYQVFTVGYFEQTTTPTTSTSSSKTTTQGSKRVTVTTTHTTGGTSTEVGTANLSAMAEKVPGLILNVQQGKVTYVGRVIVTMDDAQQATGVEFDSKPEYEKALLNNLANEQAYKDSRWQPIFKQAADRLAAQ